MQNIRFSEDGQRITSNFKLNITEVHEKMEKSQAMTRTMRILPETSHH